MKKIAFLLAFVCCGFSAFAGKKTEPVVVAYVTSWTQDMPDPAVMTHLNYAFGHVNDQFNGVRIDNEQRLRDLVSLKRRQPALRVMLSIGGWGSGRFCEMAASEENRVAFAKDCRRVCDEFKLDGIDIDWEYPTQGGAGISSSPQDTEHFTLLMRDLRQALGKKLWLTLASVSSAQYIDFRGCQQYLDLVNVMAYDMGNAPKHHAALYRSKNVGWNCASEAVEAHRKAGVPDDKIVLGMPFYGRGEDGQYIKALSNSPKTLSNSPLNGENNMPSPFMGELEGVQVRWDSKAKAPYLADKDGKLTVGFESPRSIAEKCAYIKKEGLRGAMYWEYADDNAQGDLQRAVWQGILQSGKERTAACRTAAKRLVKVLADNKKREDITPDSFFYDYRLLKAEMLREKDPTAQAIYRAAMAHLLRNNTWRSQRYRRDTSSHPDSIQEWSRQEYLIHAADLYAQALGNADALHDCKVKDLGDLAEGGKDDAIFGSDLLYIVWQAAVSDIDEDMRGQHLVPGYGDIIDVYRRRGLREATLQLRLDSLAEHYDSRDVLLRLRDEYADLPACAQVYLRLASLSGYNTHEQAQLLEEGLARYPKSREANELWNRLVTLRSPQLTAKFRTMCYPECYYNIPLEMKNMQTGNIMVYRLPNGFSFDNAETDVSKYDQVIQAGTLIETIPLDVTNADPLETKHDTIRWRTPTFGRYALVLNGTTKERTLSNSPSKGERGTPQVVLTDVTALTFMSATLPDGTVRVMVTDALSGEPQQGVKAAFFRHENREYIPLAEKTTDSRGIAEIAAVDKSFVYVKLSRGEDNVHEKEGLGWRYTPENSDRISHHKRLYADRSIYRPGQMVYVGGIAYTQSHDQAPQAEAGAEFDITLYDANGQEVVKHTLTADEFGTIQDSLELPKSGLPGRYAISCSGEQLSIRVEEYRRPTFQVEMDEAPAVQLPADSVTLTGRALTYSQWPVANARVTGTYRWEPCWWWYRDYRPSDPRSIDTLYTDAEGRFSVRIPIDRSREQLRWGQTLRLSVDVLSAEGETQQGSTFIWLCSTPLRLRGEVPGQECRENLKPWRFYLYASNNKEVEGDVLCRLLQKDKEVGSFTIPAGRDTIPAQLLTLPSGEYDLRAMAVVKGDTAEYRTTFTIFSIKDTHLLGKHDLWLYAPSDTMSAERPARFQVGTTLSDAWIYCVMSGEDCVVRDTLLHLSDCAVHFEVPYEERFRHHLNVTLMLMKHGETHRTATDFTLQQPDTQLRMRWDTFRDQMQPGQKEQWRLTLTRPDGTPASANVMVGMYDASLDALVPYGMSLGISRSCSRSVSLHVNGFSFIRSRYCMFSPSLYFLPTKGYDFAWWNEDFFGGVPMTRGGKGSRSIDRLEERVYATMAAPAPVYAGAVRKFNMKDVEGLEFESVDQALQGQIAGLDIVKNSEDLADGATMRLRGMGTLEEAEEEGEDDAASVRSNLSELAFFYPQLRTDSKGQTSIEFTLPEGLTSWHLHGLAHTQDMMTARWQETIVAKKELMAELTLPRFLRNGDEAALTASIRNASEKRQKGEAVLTVYCLEEGQGARSEEQGARSKEQGARGKRMVNGQWSMVNGQWSMVNGQWCQRVKQMKVQFDLAPGESAVYNMPFTTTLDHPVLAVRWVAKAQNGSDGEMRYLPVLSDMQNVTETKTYMLRGDTTLRMDLSGLFGSKEQGARGKTLTVEHVSDPITLALQALPSLTAPKYNDVLSVATAFYGGSVAYHLAHKYTGLRGVIESWAEEEDSQALESPLVKNQQLADILLNETPWMVEAKQQKASRQRIAKLFAEMKQEQRRMAMLSALSARQHSDGSFGWFPGMSGSVWMTSEVAMLFVRLAAIVDVLPVPERQVLDRAMSFIAKDMHEDVEELRKEKKPTLSFYQLRYLYIYIMYSATPSASSLKKEYKEDAQYLLSLLKKQAEDLDREPRALAAIVLKRAGEEKKAQALMPRIHELLRHADGVYLAYPGGSFTSIDRKVETHVNLMEAVGTVEPKETELFGRMAEWLIQQKRTQDWEQPIQSADAVYVLTLSNSPLKEENTGKWSGSVAYDGKVLPLKEEGPYVRERIEPINKAKELLIRQELPSASGEGMGKGAALSWGAVYAQYQLPALEAEANREGMTIRREVQTLSAASSTVNGQQSMVNGQWSMFNGQCSMGARIHVRYTITADRDYEYVCLRAPRPAAAEPVQQLSGYHYQNGLGYYQAIHDASTEFFMDSMPRGTYVIEEDWLISRTGNFLLPPARLTCLYAPEYQSQTAGEKFTVR